MAVRLEHRRQPLIPLRAFARRMAAFLGSALAIVAVALGIGMWGYHRYEGMSWLDAFLNAAMILGGMGPVDVLHSQAGKLFAGFYALLCGLVFIGIAGLVMAPLVHRLLHRFHVGDEEE